MVKKKENSKRTYNGTKKTMKARRKRKEAREQKQKRNEASENPSPMQENKQTSETKTIYKPLVKKKESELKRTYNGTRTQ